MAKSNPNNPKAITPAQAIAAFERAFRSGNPNEVEQLLRDMMNVQVAVVESVEEGKRILEQNKRFRTVSVPYGVFLGKSSGKKVYCIDWGAIKRRDFDNALKEVSRDEILPSQTYVLLKQEAGYSKEEGLTFEGEGDTTGVEEQIEAERREKFTEGQFQTWKEHAQGAFERAKRLAEIYRPFISAWAEKVLSSQWGGQEEKKEEFVNSFVNSIVWALQVAVCLHDVGKLNKEWQKVVWKNEQKIRGQEVDWKSQKEFIARTSTIPDPRLRKHLDSPPSHAPFAYPFLKAFLRTLLGDYRLWDAIALATARHHSLEVAGVVQPGFENVDGADEIMLKLLKETLGGFSEEEQERLREALDQAFQAVSKQSEADEPPSPSDDFYFIYCLANRLVKVCDWEDAGQETIELPELRGDDDGVTD